MLCAFKYPRFNFLGIFIPDFSLITSYKISGNYAAALSLAAKLRGIPGYIIIPKNAPKCKVENVKRYGGRVIWSESNLRSREDTATKVLQETGAVLLHPYNDGRTIRCKLAYILNHMHLLCLILACECAT